MHTTNIDTPVTSYLFIKHPPFYRILYLGFPAILDPSIGFIFEMTQRFLDVPSNGRVAVPNRLKKKLCSMDRTHAAHALADAGENYNTFSKGGAIVFT